MAKPCLQSCTILFVVTTLKWNKVDVHVETFLDMDFLQEKKIAMAIPTKWAK